MDEILIDNSRKAGRSILAYEVFSYASWTEWYEAEKAEAVSAAVEFANYVNLYDVTIFFVSDRKTGAEFQPTVNNLKVLDLQV